MTYEWGEHWESSAIQYEDQPSDLERADWFHRGYGPQWEYEPQRAATVAEAASMQTGWDRLVAKAAADINAIERGTYDERGISEDDDNLQTETGDR